MSIEVRFRFLQTIHAFETANAGLLQEDETKGVGELQILHNLGRSVAALIAFPKQQNSLMTAVNLLAGNRV
jgi:hypothetical protein